jgi:pullulanase
VFSVFPNWRAFGKSVWLASLAMGAVSCERGVVKDLGKFQPPPQPRGEVVATLEAVVPAGQSGRPVFAGLKLQGRIVARGTAVCDHGRPLTIPLRAMEPGGDLADDVYELWVTIDRDGMQSCYPSFGDLFIHTPWELTKADRHKKLMDAGVWQERKLSAPGNLVTVHYHRYDADYDNVGIWTWDASYQRSPEPNELFEVGWDDFGVIFQLDRGAYGLPGTSPEIGLLPRLAGDWNRKEGENRCWKPALGSEVWLISSRPQIWSQRPDLSPQVVSAHLDAPQRVVIQLSQLVAADALATNQIHVADEAGHVTQPVKLRLVTPGGRDRSNFIEAILYEPLAVAEMQYRVRVDGFQGEAVAVPRGVLDEADLFADETAELGATYSAAATTFRVFAPTALAASVVLYDEATGTKGRTTHPLQRGAKGIWSATLAGDLEGKFYMYHLAGPDFPADHEAVDIYAINTVDSTRRARITDLAKTNPPDWDRLKKGPTVSSPVDMVVYEMHVRDMTIAPNSGVAPEKRGKYLGFIEKIPHLQELGVTHVQLLPVQDFENDEGRTNYNWGYVTTAFHSPEGWFASNRNDDSRIREFKQLIAALHAAGIGVIMDVVYNHTGSSAPFNRLVPRYYYRFHPDGSYSNGSGCGNDFRTEAPMGRKYLVDSLKYWVSEYGIDGFRFDLMAMLDLETMKEAEAELRALNPDIVLYGEPWMAGPSAMKGRPTDKGTIRGTRIGAFNDQYRNALIGSPFHAEEGAYIQNGTGKHDVEKAIEGSRRWWADKPGQTINYLSCHDNYVILDKLRASRPDVGLTEHIGMMKFGYFILFTSQGVPFLHGGEEFARTKQGNHNSYNAPDEINQVDWSLKDKHHDLFTYTRDLIALRKTHPAFRIRAKEQIAAWLRFHDTGNEGAILYTIAGSLVEGEPWKNICVIANPNDALSVEVVLPDGRWYVALDHTGALPTPRETTGSVRVRYKSGLVLYQL